MKCRNTASSFCDWLQHGRFFGYSLIYCECSQNIGMSRAWWQASISFVVIAFGMCSRAYGITRARRDASRFSLWPCSPSVLQNTLCFSLWPYLAWAQPNQQKSQGVMTCILFFVYGRIWHDCGHIMGNSSVCWDAFCFFRYSRKWCDCNQTIGDPRVRWDVFYLML